MGQERGLGSLFALMADEYSPSNLPCPFGRILLCGGTAVLVLIQLSHANIRIHHQLAQVESADPKGELPRHRIPRLGCCVATIPALRTWTCTLQSCGCECKFCFGCLPIYPRGRALTTNVHRASQRGWDNRRCPGGFVSLHEYPSTKK